MHLQPCDWLARVGGLGGRGISRIMETQVRTPLGQGVMAHNLPAWPCARVYKPGLIKVSAAYSEKTHLYWLGGSDKAQVLPEQSCPTCSQF